MSKEAFMLPSFKKKKTAEFMLSDSQIFASKINRKKKTKVQYNFIYLLRQPHPYTVWSGL